MIAAIDLEGVLAPGIRPRLRGRFEIQQVHIAKRDTECFDVLVSERAGAVAAVFEIFRRNRNRE